MDRRSRLLCCWIVILLIALGVSARQTLDILDLDDDASDETVALSEDSLPSIPDVLHPVEISAPPAADGPPSSARISRHHFYFGPTLDASARAGRDLLKFLSLERK